MPHYIFVTGGVVSSLGKGIASASIGKLLEARGLRVVLVKCDPYLNVDAGTMNPFQHGEVYVTEDGAETDLDLGHYERFTDTTLTRAHNITAGKIYQTVINKERRGDYLGSTVQVIPHVTDEIKAAIKQVAESAPADVLICEIGGTAGDIESLPFLEAIRQMRRDMAKNNKTQEGKDVAINIHVTLVPWLHAASEMKTKPTQHSVGRLREIGIQPDILLCRTQKPLPFDAREKIALFCSIDVECVVQALDVQDVYQVPLALKKEGLDTIITRLLNLHNTCDESQLTTWQTTVVDRICTTTDAVTIGVVGKYIELQDAYKSICEALKHGGIAHSVHVEICRIDAEEIINNFDFYGEQLDAILVPGGFGNRGIEGKIKAITYARTHKIPFLGICLGMQCATIEFARNVCGLDRANSMEFDAHTPFPVISLLEEQRAIDNRGGTMRLGAYPCAIKESTLARKVYGCELIHERHRHRYEFNETYRAMLESKGMIVSGTSPDDNLVEMIELKDHPWFIGCQFHPEFKSKPDQAHPLFREFIRAACEYSKQKKVAALNRKHEEKSSCCL